MKIKVFYSIVEMVRPWNVESFQIYELKSLLDSRIRALKTSADQYDEAAPKITFRNQKNSHK
jgi:hypothetical protein